MRNRKSDPYPNLRSSMSWTKNLKLYPFREWKQIHTRCMYMFALGQKTIR